MFNRRLDELVNHKYFITLPFDVCKSRRVLRNYQPPEPYETYFEEKYWPVYEAQLMEANARNDLSKYAVKLAQFQYKAIQSTLSELIIFTTLADENVY